MIRRMLVARQHMGLSLFFKSYWILLDFSPRSETKAAKISVFKKTDLPTEEEEEEEKKKESQCVDPPDGGWGWMVVLHCFLVCPT